MCLRDYHMKHVCVNVDVFVRVLMCECGCVRVYVCLYVHVCSVRAFIRIQSHPLTNTQNNPHPSPPPPDRKATFSPA